MIVATHKEDEVEFEDYNEAIGFMNWLKSFDHDEVVIFNQYQPIKDQYKSFEKGGDLPYLRTTYRVWFKYPAHWDIYYRYLCFLKDT